MFEDLRIAFREALDNFNKELHRDQVPETVDRLLAGMRNELADEKAEVYGLEAELEKALAGSLREKEAAETCRRRERQAREIGDEETVALATRHALRHEGHYTVLVKKVEAVREELAFRRRSVEEMSAQLSEAVRKRGSLGATAGRTGARSALTEADDLFGELDRMAAKMEGRDAEADAAEIVDSLDFDGPAVADYEVGADDPGGPAPGTRAEGVGRSGSPDERDVDAALAELKRRMGRE